VRRRYSGWSSIVTEFVDDLDREVELVADVTDVKNTAETLRAKSRQEYLV
jgi:hypothetical protein